MPASAKEKWNRIYSENEYGFFPPALVLHRHAHLLPTSGHALDLAAGIGRNAIFLAQQGMTVEAIDISDVALEKIKAYAESEQLAITTTVSDLDQTTSFSTTYDVIVISHYLNRDLIPTIKQALKPGGLIFYQTFIKDKVENIGPSNPDYLLASNELLSLFHDYQIIVYREDATIGDHEQGFRNEAMLIAQKP